MSERLFDQLPAIEKSLRAAPRWLIGIDFDGTISAIVPHPARAELEPQTRPALEALAAHPRAKLTVISGRDRVDLEARIAVPNIIYAGNHGLDICGPAVSYIDPAAIDCQPAMNALGQSMADKLRNIEGAIVEDKGLTLTIHYRMVPDEAQEEVRRNVHSVLAGTNHPFVLTVGDKVFEVRPRTYWNKGTALNWIKDQLCPDARILYIGDDQTDEDAFRACTEGIAVRVGRSEETAAGYFVDAQSDVPAFLEWLTLRL